MLKWALVVFIAYAIVACAAYFLQDKLLYYPYGTIEANPKNIGLDYEDVFLTTEDDSTIHGWYVPGREDRRVVLFCHGNAGNISHRMDSIRIFNNLGLSVFIFDYRGYGQSTGRPSEQGTYRDAEAAWRYLRQSRNKAPEQIIVFGRSLGAAVAANIGMHFNPGCILLESGFLSYAEIASDLYPWLPVRLIAKYRYASSEAVQRISCPKLFIHSPDDDIIPYRHGRELFERAAAPKEFLKISGDHNTGFLTSGSVYSEGIRMFLENHTGI